MEEGNVIYTADELEAYRLVYGRDPPELREAAQAAALAATRGGVEIAEDVPEVVEPLPVTEVTSETLRDTLLGALALAHARVVAGKFGSGNGEQAGLEKLTSLVRDFPDLAKALDVVAGYERPAQVVVSEAEVAAAPAVVSETVRRLRAMGYGK